MDTRYDALELETLAARALAAAGLPAEPAAAVAKGLLAADLYGHTTHGLALLPDYIEEIEAGTMETEGRPLVVSRLGAVECWDARRLPGVWTAALAVAAASKLAEVSGLGAVALRRSHHIACLAALLEEPARNGTLVLVFSSDPGDAHVAPFGGTTPVMTPNPIAAGIPGMPDPILIDISTSITTAGLCARARSEGRMLEHDWLMSAEGVPTRDPQVLRAGGSILPLGGLAYGHKGFALSLLVEALTQGLSGHGRADEPKGWGAAVLVIALSTAAFSGRQEFERQTGWLAAACRASAPLPGKDRVRLPGEAALARKRQALAQGVTLYPAVETRLKTLLKRLNLPEPQALRR